MKVVADFRPPGAPAAARRWRDEHASLLASLPEDAVRVEVGRAEGGDFYRISVAEEYADRFGDEAPPL